MDFWIVWQTGRCVVQKVNPRPLFDAWLPKCSHFNIFTFQYSHIFFFQREKIVWQTDVLPKRWTWGPSPSLALMPGYLFPPLTPPPTRGQTIAEIWKTIIKEIWNRKGKPLTDSLTQWPIHKIFGGEIPQIPDYTSNQHASSCNTKRRNKKTKIHEE